MFKINYHKAICFYYSGIIQQEQGKYGLAIAYLKEGKNRLEECANSKPPQEYLQSLKYLLANLELK